MRTSLLFGIATAGLSAMLLTGCLKDDDTDTDARRTPAPAPTASATDTTAQSPGGAADPSDSGTDSGTSTGDLDGGWLGESDVDKVAAIIQGQEVMLAFQSTDGAERHACEGLLKQTAIRLRCIDDNKDRLKGTVEISSSEKIVIAWSSGKKDLLTRSGDGQTDFSQWGLPSAPAAPSADRRGR